jgi:hypothetical protein
MSKIANKKLIKSFCGCFTGWFLCQRWQVQVTGAGEELENGIKKEANFNRSPMPWAPWPPGPAGWIFGRSWKGPLIAGKRL